MVTMLAAIPKTPLYDRLTDEGRLDPNESEFGTNVIPLEMSRQQLRDGFASLMQDLYRPEAYFQRFEDLYLSGEFHFGVAQTRWQRRHPWSWAKARAVELARSAILYRRLMRGTGQPANRHEYRRRLWRLLKTRPDSSVLFIFLLKCAVHYHVHAITEQMAQGKVAELNPF